MWVLHCCSWVRGTHQLDSSPAIISAVQCLAGKPAVQCLAGNPVDFLRAASRRLPAWPLQVGFSYPVVPKGKARIRVQLSAAHEPEHLDAAITAFKEVGAELGVLPA